MSASTSKVADMLKGIPVDCEGKLTVSVDTQGNPVEANSEQRSGEITLFFKRKEFQVSVTGFSGVIPTRELLVSLENGQLAVDLSKDLTTEHIKQVQPLIGLKYSSEMAFFEHLREVLPIAIRMRTRSGEKETTSSGSSQ